MIINPQGPFGQREWQEAGRPMLVITPSVGEDHLDREYLEERGVKVLTLRDDREGLNRIYASSEFTLLAILMGLRRIHEHLGNSHRGQRGHELHGKTVGFVGYGRIGTNVSRWCNAIGSSTWFYDPYVPGGFPLQRIFAESDIVCITCSLTPGTTGMIDYALLQLLTPDAVLVNTARGAIIKEADLLNFLKARRDVPAVLDVLEGELWDRHLDSQLWDMPNVCLTPHLGGYTHESMTKARAIAERLEALYPQ